MLFWASPVAQPLEHLPVMQETQETWVWSLGQEEPLEEEMANSFQYFRLENTTDSKLASLQSVRSQRVRLKRPSPHAHRLPSSFLHVKRRPGSDSEPSRGEVGPGARAKSLSGPAPCLPQPTALRSPDGITPLSDLPSWVRVLSLISVLQIFALIWPLVDREGTDTLAVLGSGRLWMLPVFAAVCWGLSFSSVVSFNLCDSRGMGWDTRCRWCFIGGKTGSDRWTRLFKAAEPLGAELGFQALEPRWLEPLLRCLPFAEWTQESCLEQRWPAGLPGRTEVVCIWHLAKELLSARKIANLSKLIYNLTKI